MASHHRLKRSSTVRSFYGDLLARQRLGENIFAPLASFPSPFTRRTFVPLAVVEIAARFFLHFAFKEQALIRMVVAFSAITIQSAPEKFHSVASPVQEDEPVPACRVVVQKGRRDSANRQRPRKLLRMSTGLVQRKTRVW